MKHPLRLVLLLILAAGLFTGCKKTTGGSTVPTAKYLHASGSIIKDGNGNAVRLQGVAFGNDIWNEEIPAAHHSEADFKRVSDMHMNVVRFYMNYKTFESDAAPYTYKQTGWDWIDKNIAWAKKYGVLLILNMHAPQGGYQSQGTGDALWNVVENQNRLTALWKAIATRYKDEPTIIGFGLVNEPVPVQSLAQWQQLAQRIATAVRTVDKNHILFLEKPIYVKNEPGENADYNFPVINDNNVAYEFHIYDPIQYTHQLFTWAHQGEGGKYPDENIISYSNSSWYTDAFNNPLLPSGNSNWQYVEGEKYTITDSRIKIGLAVLAARNVTGTAFFDDVVVKEFDPQGNFTGNVVSSNLNSIDGWSYWSVNNTGSGNADATTGHSDGACLFVSAATGDCNLSNYRDVFIPKQGYAYQACGWMKGQQVAIGAACMLRTDYLSTSDPVTGRNKAYLAAALNRYINWGRLKNVPIYMGEFGAGVHCFENNKGGLQWVTDMVDICKANNIYFTYHAYHEDSFGLYYGTGTLPDPANANTALINLFTQKLQ